MGYECVPEGKGGSEIEKHNYNFCKTIIISVIVKVPTRSRWRSQIEECMEGLFTKAAFT